MYRIHVSVSCSKHCHCVWYKADINLHDSMGRHALHLAAEANSTAAVRFLLTDAGVDVNLQTVVARDTALHFAAKVYATQVLS